MKKRNKPTALIVVLGLFVVAAAGINGVQSGLFKMPKPEEPTTTASRESGSSATSVAASTKKVVGDLTKTAAPPKSSQAAMMLQGRNGRPLMAVDVAKNAPVVQPKPNDSSTSTHWYSGDSAER